MPTKWIIFAAVLLIGPPAGAAEVVYLSCRGDVTSMRDDRGPIDLPPKTITLVVDMDKRTATVDGVLHTIRVSDATMVLFEGGEVDRVTGEVQVRTFVFHPPDAKQPDEMRTFNGICRRVERLF